MGRRNFITWLVAAWTFWLKYPSRPEKAPPPEPPEGDPDFPPEPFVTDKFDAEGLGIYGEEIW